jgi:NADH-quinone oxidoreductase subunit M
VLAYSTLSHAGLLLIGVFCQGSTSFLGVLLVLLGSAIATGGMMMMLDDLGNNTTLDLSSPLGLWEHSPRFSSLLLIFLLASMGFPLFGNFVGEWLIFWTAFVTQPALAIVASLGIVLAAVYSLRLFQRLCLYSSSSAPISKSCDLSPARLFLYGCMVGLLVALGLKPSLLSEHLKEMSSSVSSSINRTTNEFCLSPSTLSKVNL